MNMTLNQFARTLGEGTRKTREYTLAWHVAYVKADPAAQKTWRKEFIQNYVAGYLNVSEKTATNICAQSRTERKPEHHLAYHAGRRQFDYHIARPEKGEEGHKQVPTTRYRAPNGLKTAMASILETYGKDAIIAYLKHC